MLDIDDGPIMLYVAAPAPLLGPPPFIGFMIKAVQRNWQWSLCVDPAITILGRDRSLLQPVAEPRRHWLWHVWGF